MHRSALGGAPLGWAATLADGRASEAKPELALTATAASS